MARAHDRENDIGFGMRLQVICRENEADAWEAADQLVRHATERQKQEMKTLYNKSEANQRVQQLAREHGDLLLPHLWTGITKVRPGAGIAVVGNPAQCADTLQQFIDAGCHSFCLSGYLHDEEAERFGRLIRRSSRRTIADGWRRDSEGINSTPAPVCSIARQDSGDELVAAFAVRLKHRCLALARCRTSPCRSASMMFGLCDTITVLVPAWMAFSPTSLRNGCRAPVVLDGGDDMAASLRSGRGFDVAEAGQCAGVHRALEHAGLNLAYGYPQLAHRLADGFRERAALFVELALLGDVVYRLSGSVSA